MINQQLSFRPLTTSDLLTVAELSREEIEMLLTTAAAFKRRPQDFRQLLAGRTLTMLFEKPSLRTRVSFEIGFAKLGGQVLYIDHQGSRIGQRESTSDNAEATGDPRRRTRVDTTVERLFAFAELLPLER